MRLPGLLYIFVSLVACLEQEGVVETAVEHFSYIPRIYNKHIGIQNVVLKPKELYLKSGLARQALLRWDLPNGTENWSFSFKFNDLNLSSNESAGIYLRYTEEMPLIGNFMGGEGVYHGAIVGMEFSGKVVNIVYAKNEGLDYEHTEDFILKKDEIHPARFRDLREMTMKVISTDKNFKVEVYDGDKLVYDKFRLYDMAKEGLNQKAKYFGIVVNYKNTPSGKAFVLKEAQLYKRVEDDTYDVHKIYTEQIKQTYRERDQIAHHDGDIREYIHKSELIMSFIKAVLGDLPNTRLATLEKDTKKEIAMIGERVEKLQQLLKSRGRRSSFNAQLNDFEIKIKQIQRTVGEMDYLIEKSLVTQKESPSRLKYAIFAVGCVLLYMLGQRELNALRDLVASRNK